MLSLVSGRFSRPLIFRVYFYRVRQLAKCLLIPSVPMTLSVNTTAPSVLKQGKLGSGGFVVLFGGLIDRMSMACETSSISVEFLLRVS